MSLFRRCVEQMTAYVPGKQPPPGSRVVKLNTNENPYPPSPEVARAILCELENGAERLRRYSDPSSTGLRQAVAEVTGFPVDGILAGNGSDEILALLMRAIVEPGQVVAYPEPTYVLYETLAQAQGARVLSIPFERDFRLPEGLFGCGARVVFVASPNSPSGNSHPERDLERLAESLPDGLLVVDEAYADFASTHALALARRRSNVVVTRTLSKSYSLAGLRVGFLFGAPELVAGVAKVKDSYNLDRLALAGAEAAVRDQSWMRENVERVRRTRSRLVEGLEALGFAVLPSEANFVFARLGSAARARAAYEHLEASGILVRYFSRPDLEDGLRISVGSEDETSELLRSLRDHLG